MRTGHPARRTVPGHLQTAAASQRQRQAPPVTKKHQSAPEATSAMRADSSVEEAQPMITKPPQHHVRTHSHGRTEIERRRKNKSRPSLPAALDTAGHSGTHPSVTSEPASCFPRHTAASALELECSFFLISTQLPLWPLPGCVCAPFREASAGGPSAPAPGC